MDKDGEKTNSDDGKHLTRNRSFKSKQLVRSQAIRESHSPPRTLSPMMDRDMSNQLECVDDKVICDVECTDEKGKVEIQISPGTTNDQFNGQRHRAGRWLSRVQSPGDLLSYGPRVTCVCVHCSRCRGKRKEGCPVKQDSGISCSEDCPDCSDVDQSGGDCSKSHIDEVDENCKCNEKKERLHNVLVRTDSDEKTELSGVELVGFLKATLNKNPRDRVTLLKIEKELHSLVNDNGRCIVRFPVMTSYGRMLVHRVASLFQLSHHLDLVNKGCVVVSKNGTSGGRIPCTPFKQWCTSTFPSTAYSHDTPQAKSILKRSAHSLDETGNSASGGANSNSKSLEQREKDYETLRTRIFSSDNCSQDYSQWPWLPSGPVKLLTPDTGKKLLKVQSLEAGEAPCTRERGPVSKSHSFGGYGGSDPPQRLLSRQGDLASSSWRLSPSSSGYKTLSLRSTDSVTPSPTGGVSPEPSLPIESQPKTLVWAISAMSAVPAGALIIHPQTGQPLTNADGSIYHFDPANPPVFYDNTPHVEEKVDQNNEKRRGRLEKQHSFMDNECDCQATGDCRKECLCGYQSQENVSVTQQSDQLPQRIEPKLQSIPNSPIKNRYENVPTNEEAAAEIPTNHAASYDAQSTNHRQAVSEFTNQGTPYKCEDIEKNMQSSYMDNSYLHQYVEQVESPTQSYQNMNYAQDGGLVKPTTSPLQDPSNMRGVPLQNVTYPTQAPQGFAYNQRMESYSTPLYQQLPNIEDTQKIAQSTDHTFRIDASYPYAPIETYTAACPTQCNATCVDPNTIAHRSVSVYGTPIETQQVYPLSNVMVPHQYPMAQYQHIQWQTNIQPLITQQIQSNCTTPIQKPTSPIHTYIQPDLPIYPQVYNNQIYPILQYPYNYQQIIPQMMPTYPIYPPVYPQTETPNDLFKSYRHSPQDVATVQEKPYEPKRFHKTYEKKVFKTEPNVENNEIANTIAQIKERMAALSTGDEKIPRKDEYRWRRNNGNGILGSYPSRIGQSNDEPSTSSTRTFNNTIRNVQAKNNYYHENARRTDTQNPIPREFHYQRNKPRYQDREKTDKDESEPRPFSRPLDNYSRRNNTSVPPMQYRQAYMLRQMTPNTWCRRSPAPIPPAFNTPRRPPPDVRNQRR